jgi:hypothetical protein
MKTIIAQIFLVLGLIVSLADWFMPFQPQASMLHDLLNPTLSLALTVALLLWFVGDAILLVVALPDSDRTYVVQQLNCLAAGILALAPVSDLANIALRILCATISVFALIRLGYIDSKIVLPCILHWKKNFDGEYGPRGNWLVGTEFMAWGVAMLGVSNALGWVLLAVANFWLARWNWLDVKEGKIEAKVWFRINLAFFVVAVAQVVHAVI